MPVPTEKAANFMRMVKATQRGHEITGIKKATKKKLRKTAATMQPMDEEHFMHTAGDFAGMSMKPSRRKVR